MYQFDLSLIQNIRNNKASLKLKISALHGTVLAVQWLGLCLLMQGAQVRSLVGEVGSLMPGGQEAKTQNRSNVVTSSIKT